MAVLLGELARVEESVRRRDAAAGTGGVVLVNLAPDAVPPPQPAGAAEPGKARAHDDDARAVSGRRRGPAGLVRATGPV
jgi:hypothetical protein